MSSTSVSYSNRGTTTVSPKLPVDVEAHEFALTAGVCQGLHPPPEGLRAEYFVNDEYRNLCELAGDLTQAGLPLSYATMLQARDATELSISDSTLHEVFSDRVTGTLPDYHVRKLAENYTHQQRLKLKADIEHAIKSDRLSDARELFDELAKVESGKTGPWKDWQRKSVWQAVDNPKPQRQIVIDGLVRRGEVVNIVASTKIGKSWLALLLAFCVALGRAWLGRKTTQGRVLLIDNELYDDTIENRCSAIARQGGFEDTGVPFEYLDLRGRAAGIYEVRDYLLSEFSPGDLTMIVLDAKYRFFSGKMQENSNDDQTTFHNIVDNLARSLDCVIVLVHHSTKGDQSQKDVTDIGAGGGSQSRTVDTHLALIPHNDSKNGDLFVLDGKVRTFAPGSLPMTLRWEWPLWTAEHSVEPVRKEAQSGGERRQAQKDKKALSELADVFHRHRGEPLSRHELRTEFGGSQDRINRLLRLGIDQELFEHAGTRPNKKKPDEQVDVFILSSDYEFHSDDSSDF